MLKNYINKGLQDTIIEEEKMVSLMKDIMSGSVAEEDLQEFLVQLYQRGEHVSEITGAARVMREKAKTLKAPEDALDCCGTGGDGIGTYNISTAVAIVSASCGVPIAKHGNRAASSRSGAADVLEQLGINLDLTTEQLEHALQEYKFCFLMAPNHHSAMKHVMPVRKQLAHRTIFNLLGPLSNPASTKFQLLGVFDGKWLVPLAQTLKNLGTKRAWVIYGSDGLDEITTTGETYAAILNDDGSIEEKTLTPSDFGVDTASLEDLKGGTAEENAAALRAILDGKQNAYRDIVVANTAACIHIHNPQIALLEAASQAAESLDSGKAAQLLQSYATYSQDCKQSSSQEHKAAS